MVNAQTVMASATFEGVSYTLYAEAVIVVRDEDAGQLVTRVEYPSMAAADAAYAVAVAAAEAAA